MIDWISGKLLTDGTQLETGHIVSTTKDDNIVYDINKWEQVELEGSYSSRIGLKPCEPSRACRDRAAALDMPCPDRVIAFSGNPAKAAQGHNCWGPPPALAEQLVLDLTNHIPPHILVPPAKALLDVTRLDIAIMIDLHSDATVDQWIQTMARQSRSRQGKALLAESTVYWGKNSRHWTIKAYNKHKELLVPGHGPTNPLLLRKCREATEGMLRIELTLRALELPRISEWNDELVWTYMQRVEVNAMRAYENWQDVPLKGRALNELKLWLTGEDIKAGMSRATWYRLRHEIREATGADISLSPQTAADIFPMTDFNLTYLKAHVVPCTISLADTLWQPGKQWTSDSAFRYAN